MLRLDLGPSVCADALLAGAGDDLVFVSDRGPLKNGVPLGGRIGELIFDEGAEDPAGCMDAIAEFVSWMQRSTKQTIPLG